MTKPKTKRTKKTKQVEVSVEVAVAPPTQEKKTKKTLLPHQTTSEILALRERVELIEAMIERLEQKLIEN